MYQDSDLFKKTYNYATKHYDYVAILSAKHGLLLPDKTIEAYDLTLKSMSGTAQKKWAERVLKQMKNTLPMNEITTVFFHTGLLYRRYLRALLETQGIQCIVPLEGLGLGKQKAWYLNH